MSKHGEPCSASSCTWSLSRRLQLPNCFSAELSMLLRLKVHQTMPVESSDVIQFCANFVRCSIYRTRLERKKIVRLCVWQLLPQFWTSADVAGLWVLLWVFLYILLCVFLCVLLFLVIRLAIRRLQCAFGGRLKFEFWNSLSNLFATLTLWSRILNAKCNSHFLASFRNLLAIWLILVDSGSSRSLEEPALNPKWKSPSIRELNGRSMRDRWELKVISRIQTRSPRFFFATTSQPVASWISLNSSLDRQQKGNEFRKNQIKQKLPYQIN